MSMSTMSVEEGADVAKEAMLNVRLTPEMQERIMAVIQATGGEVTRTALVERSLDMFLRVLELEPTMIPQYNPRAHLSVSQKGKA